MLETAILLLVVFQMKHFLADYVLQTDYMLKKTLPKGWMAPLCLHAMTHGMFTLMICILFAPALSWLALVDGAIHFMVDRMKAVASKELSPTKKQYWVLLGADQSLHHLTHYFLIFILMKGIV